MDEALRSELERMREADQAIRLETRAVVEAHGLSSPEYAELRTRGRALDARHVARLVEILERHGWPGRSLVGETACQGAFLVLQHADLAVQKRYLPLVRAATAAGEIERTALPLLEDRVLMGEGRKQVYGSQLHRTADGRIEPWPVEDAAHVDERRASVGLEPLADYLRRFGPAAPRGTEAERESGGRG